ESACDRNGPFESEAVASSKLRPSTFGISTSFARQSASRAGPSPLKKASETVPLHWPLSRCQMPFRKTTLSVSGEGKDGDVNDAGGAFRYASALSMNVLKISAGNVPPAT